MLFWRDRRPVGRLTVAALNGVLMIGWSTAVIDDVLRSVLQTAGPKQS